jgi:hypothetical protein
VPLGQDRRLIRVALRQVPAGTGVVSLEARNSSLSSMMLSRER